LRIVPYREMADPRFALLLQNMLATKYATAAKIVPNRHGKLWTKHRESIYILEEYLRGKPKRLTKELLGICGRELGRMHKMASQFVDEDTERTGWTKYIDRVLSLPIAEWDKIRCQKVAAFEASTSAARKVLECSMAQGKLPLGIHGDINPTNMLWVGDKVAFCDFANAQAGPQIVDLAMAIFGCCVLDWDLDTGLEEDLTDIKVNISCCRALLNGYTYVRPVTNEEKSLIRSTILFAVRIWMPWLKFNSLRARNKILSLVGKFATSIDSLL